MLYAQMNNHKNKNMDWPLEWEQCNDMFKYLNSMTWGYQLNIERRMFNSGEYPQYPQYPQYRCTLIRWGVISEDRKREVLLETSDPKQMEAALFMLINETEVQYKARQNRVSMVP